MEKKNLTPRLGLSRGVTQGVMRKIKPHLPAKPVGQVTLVEVIAYPEETVDVLTLRDGTILELEADRIQVFWSRREYDDGRAPIRTVFLYAEDTTRGAVL